MSDQPGQPPVPQEPAPIQPAPPYAPQQYPPQGYAVAPGDPSQQPVKKKSRAWIWIVVVVVLLMCCVGTAIAGLIGFGIKSSADQAATVKTADDAYTKAVKGLQAAAESAATVDDPEASAKATDCPDPRGAPPTFRASTRRTRPRRPFAPSRRSPPGSRSSWTPPKRASGSTNRVTRT
jgi:hypothetical protein